MSKNPFAKIVLKFFIVFIHVCVCARVYECVPRHTCGSQRTRWRKRSSTSTSQE